MSDGGWQRFGFRQDRWAWVGGSLAFLAVASIRILIGRLYGEAEVVRFLEGIEDPALFFASALATSSTTILALMLTLLSFVHRLDADFDDEFFQRIYRIGLYTAITLAGAVLLIVALIFPLGEFKTLPQSWFAHLYTGVVLVMAALAALIFVTVVLLFSTVRRVIATVRPEVSRQEPKKKAA